jgi:hypothetical protein
MEAKIKVAKVKKGELAPIVAYFPNGPPPATSLALAVSEPDDADLELQQRADQGGSKRKRAHRRLIAKLPRGEITASRTTREGYVQGEQLVYEGKNYGGADSRAQQRNHYAIGVFDKKTGVLRVVPAELFAMRPAAKKLAIDLPAEDDRTQQLYGRQKLTQKFGSVKRKQELQRYQMNQTGEENLVSGGADLGGALEKGAELASVVSVARVPLRSARSAAGRVASCERALYISYCRWPPKRWLRLKLVALSCHVASISRRECWRMYNNI